MNISPIKPGYSSLPQPEMDDGDGIARSKWLEREWIALDTMGTARNSLGATATFAGSMAPAGVLAAIPIMQVLGGAGILYSAITETVPKSYQAWVKAMKNDEVEGHQEGVISTGLGFANQVSYLGIGALFTAAGITGLLGPEAAHAMGYAPVIGSAATEAIANLALGAACVVRGGIMMGRSIYNLRYINEFQTDFRDSIQGNDDFEKIDSAKKHLTSEYEKGKERLIRRAGKEAVEVLEKALTNPTTDEEWKAVIEQVDRGIFKQQLMQYIAFAIGLLMILGGIAAILFSAGGMIATAAVGGSCILFASMESLWIPYDSTDAFNWLVDKFYEKPQFWDEVEDATAANL
ncbi:MAG: hypothetical protein K1X28_08265 [Parachlamydiales bacterium]|nr:hypothetical protein [Parachlamydiales bacterium]